MGAIRIALGAGMSGLLLAVLTPAALAYLTVDPDYGTLAKKAQLIVIATPTARVEMTERTTIPGVRRGNSPVSAVAIDTTFSPIAILKGSHSIEDESFVLRHLREVHPSTGRGAGPNLIDFVPNDGSTYLMFLKRTADDRYEAVNGQADPAFAIEKLQKRLPARATSTPDRL